MRLSQVFVRSLFAATLASHAEAATAGQANVDERWNSQRIAPLTVAIHLSPSSPCVAAGLIVGHDDRQVYVVSVHEALAQASADAVGGLSADGWRVAVQASGRARASSTHLSARMLHDDADLGIAVLGIADSDLATEARRLAFDVLGDRTGLVRGDSVYALGCTSAQAFGQWPPRPTLPVAARDDRIFFQGSDMRDGRLGGPLVHLLGAHSTIVGLTTALRERAEARGMDRVLDRLRSWGVPVMLQPPGVTAGCTYSLIFSRQRSIMGAVNMVMFSSMVNDRVMVTVDTLPTCTWSAYGDAAPWMRVTLAGGGVSHTGPGSVALTTATANQCENNFRRGSVYVAGHVVSIGQDSTNLAICP